MLIFVVTAVPVFALIPADSDVVGPYEPEYMDIEPQAYGALETATDTAASNTNVSFYQKNYSGLFGYQFDVSSYASLPGNSVNTYFYYFDYQSAPWSESTGSKPRVYVYGANGQALINGTFVGNNSTLIGFSITEMEDHFRINKLVGGNLQYGESYSTVLKSDCLTYSSSTSIGNLLDTYSMRLSITVEGNDLDLQFLTSSGWVNVRSIELSSDSTYNTLAFATYDTVLYSPEQHIDQSFMLNYIRYGAYNKVYEDGFNSGVDYGHDDGYSDGWDVGYETGYDEGYDDGYETGFGEGVRYQAENEGSYLDVPGVVDGVFSGVLSIFESFDLTVFGISIAGLLLSVLVAGFVIFIIKKVK